ncbi:hypothetical protein [Mesorhizobium sp. M0977]|uniref:hypothetical protein n=1 Tax=unclassified Mesorhizobium TaxID=325217 RepID=UPI00333756C0
MALFLTVRGHIGRAAIQMTVATFAMILRTSIRLNGPEARSARLVSARSNAMFPRFSPQVGVDPLAPKIVALNPLPTTDGGRLESFSAPTDAGS